MLSMGTFKFAIIRAKNLRADVILYFLKKNFFIIDYE